MIVSIIIIVVSSIIIVILHIMISIVIIRVINVILTISVVNNSRIIIIMIITIVIIGSSLIIIIIIISIQFTSGLLQFTELQWAAMQCVLNMPARIRHLGSRLCGTPQPSKRMSRMTNVAQTMVVFLPRTQF
jgi:hypothetical protein